MSSDTKDNGQKRYEKFIDIYRMAHPQMSKEIQFRKGQESWKKIKNDGEIVMTLKATAAKEKNKNLKVWVNFISPPTKKKRAAQAKTVEIVDVQSDEGKRCLLTL